MSEQDKLPVSRCNNIISVVLSLNIGLCGCSRRAAPIVGLSVQCSGTNVYFIWLLITFQNREFNILLPLLFNSNSSYGVPSGSSNMAYFTTNTSAHQEMWAPTHQILATTTAEEYDSPKLPSFQRLANSGYPTGPSRTVMPPFNASQVYILALQMIKRLASG